MSGGAFTYSVLLTPPGAGAIAVIRVVGPEALCIAEGAFRPKGIASLAESDEGRLRYGHIAEPLATEPITSTPLDPRLARGQGRHTRWSSGLVDEEIIDDVIACRVMHNAQPAVEICAHGGVRVVERILSLLAKLGATFREEAGPALQAWCPQNAIEAEAIEAMVAATTERALRLAAFQRQHLTDHLQVLAERCSSEPAVARAEMERLLQGFPAARALLTGWTVAIIGPPNSGKSTLFNQLVGRTRAVVSPQAGTTRDWVEEQIEIDGLPVRLIDTAGRHETADQLEGAAIFAGTEVVADADVLILLLDQSASLPRHLPLPPTRGACILAANKSDLASAWELSDPCWECDHRVRISASEGAGVAELARAAAGLSGVGEIIEEQAAVFTVRQRPALENAWLALQQGHSTTAENIIQRQLIRDKE